MADQPVNPTPPTKPPKKELTMEVRLVLAFLLMGLVLFLTPYFYKTPPAVKPAAGAAKTAQSTSAAATPAAPEKPMTAQAAPLQPAPGEIRASSEQEFTVETDLYRIRLSNKGGVVRSWLLKKYLDHAGKPLELVNPAAFSKVPPPFALALKDEQAANALNFSLYVAKPDTDGMGILYEFSDGTNYAKKTFHFTKNGYLSEITTEVTHSGAPVPHMISWRGGFGDATVLNRMGEQHAVFYDVGQSKLILKDAKSVKDGPFEVTGNFSFAGLDDKFFSFVFLPKDNSSTRVEILKDDVPNVAGGKDEMHVGVEVGGDSVNRLSAFVGPKDVDLLRKVDPRLQQLIDWGWFAVIAKPLFLVLHWMNDNLLHNYGWSIIVITIAINLVLLPLRFSSLKSQRKMQGLQPKIQAINAKYKGLSLRDPKKQEQNQEVMDLYKKEGVNPMGGCLPMLIQLPLIYALYKVFAVSIELRGAHWLWVADLSQPEQLAIRLLPVILVVTQVSVQAMTPTPGMDPGQAKMMKYMMPLMFGFLFYNAASGLVLYWLTSNLVGIVQQWLINKTMPAPPPPVPAQKVALKRKT